MRRVVELFGASCCCLVLGVAVANAESPRLSPTELDRVTAGNLEFPPIEPIGSPPTGGTEPAPAPLFPQPSDSPFELGEGLLNPPPPLPPLEPPATGGGSNGGGSNGGGGNGGGGNGGASNGPAPQPTFRDQLADFRQILRGRF